MPVMGITPLAQRVAMRHLIIEAILLRWCRRAHQALNLPLPFASRIFLTHRKSKLRVSDTLRVDVRPGNENELESAFRPLITELNSPDLMRRAEAAAAITELAPPFLEDVLIELTQTRFAHSAISALRKADTSKTRAALAQIALGSDDSMLRIEAMQNLGRTMDAAYLPTLFQLMESGNKAIQNAAAEAAGTLGGITTVSGFLPLSMPGTERHE